MLPFSKLRFLHRIFRTRKKLAAQRGFTVDDSLIFPDEATSGARSDRNDWQASWPPVRPKNSTWSWSTTCRAWPEIITSCFPSWRNFTSTASAWFPSQTVSIQVMRKPSSEINGRWSPATIQNSEVRFRKRAPGWRLQVFLEPERAGVVLEANRHDYAPRPFSPTASARRPNRVRIGADEPGATSGA